MPRLSLGWSDGLNGKQSQVNQLTVRWALRGTAGQTSVPSWSRDDLADGIELV